MFPLLLSATNNQPAYLLNNGPSAKSNAVIPIGSSQENSGSL